MKMAVSQILHFRKAVDTVTKFINDKAQEVTDPKQREALLPLVGAVATLEQMAHLLMGAEVSVKA